MVRSEYICENNTRNYEHLATGITFLALASRACGAEKLFTGLAEFEPSVELPYHKHPCSEAMIVLSGVSEVVVEGRRYVLRQYDALHVPPLMPHSVRNASADAPLRMFTAFASDLPSREYVNAPMSFVDCLESDTNTPERIVRFDTTKEYELAQETRFRDLFVGHVNCPGICGGFGLFQPGASLPCHTHHFDESITIVRGNAVCQVSGRKYVLKNCDTALVPSGLPHRFINESHEPMAMIWVYAGDQPTRTIVSQNCCDRLHELNKTESSSTLVKCES